MTPSVKYYPGVDGPSASRRAQTRVPNAAGSGVVDFPKGAPLERRES